MPQAYRGKQSLWKDDLRRIDRLVRRHIGVLSKSRQDARSHGLEAGDLPHLSIAIFGPSGSGKSSLLRTLVDDVNRRHRQRHRERRRGTIFSLPVTDPTTWAETDQFLYAFLAAALEEEQNWHEDNASDFPQGLSPVQLAFQDVNEYLRVVDDVSGGEENDPLGMSLQKLERHTSGLRLRNTLDKFIEKLAETFRASVVLLPVDDLDMAPDHLVKSLQTYQSFLSHPRLVPVFTFTDRTPEELIEVHYDQRLGESSEARRGEGSERLTISEKLAVQFLARCFPVRNRIRLGPAPARVQRALFQIRSEKQENGSKETKDELRVLELLTIASFLLFGYPDEDDAHKVRAALRPSTLRRQFQVVDAMADCRLRAFRVPQLATMGDPEISGDELTLLVSKENVVMVKVPDGEGENPWKEWKEWHGARYRLRSNWDAEQKELLEGEDQAGYLLLAERMQNLGIGATWATVFNGAAWSLLNVHRDTLRELGLFLEDLYSWNPKELRSHVLDKILTKGRVVRRTVVDRWFNRTDYRRSQVLSLLAANIFRPWMIGEEPYGDEEIPIREQLRLEGGGSDASPLDWELSHSSKDQQIRDRLTFPATQGLLWFFNVTLGFYLPQIMARNWTHAVSPDEPVRGRMGGNGWDLLHAPINAVRVADAKQEIFSFGMIFLGPRGYRHALEATTYEHYIEFTQEQQELCGKFNKLKDESRALPTTESERIVQLTADIEKTRKKLRKREHSIETIKRQYGSPELLEKKRKFWGGSDPSPRGHLLLRIWSCCGYSRSRCWAAFSLWRGLGFIGQALELGWKERKSFEKLAAQDEEKGELKRLKEHLLFEFRRLVRLHCLAGMVPGSLLERDANDERLLQAFPRWEPRRSDLRPEITSLAKDLVAWIERCWRDRIFPLPAGSVWIGWSDCFIRRIHGEYILGALWPRLNGAYMEERPRSDCQMLARARGYSEEQLAEMNIASKKELYEALSKDLGHEEKYRWSAAVAAGAWSDILLEYWRGCPPILRLLLSCPVFLKGREYFGTSAEKGGPDREKERDVVFKKLRKSDKPDDKRKKEIWLGDLNSGERRRYDWLERLGLPAEVWKELEDEVWVDKNDKRDIKGLVPDELCIERVRVEFFASNPVQHHAVSIERTEVAREGQKEPTHTVRSSTAKYPPMPKLDSPTKSDGQSEGAEE